MSRAAPLPADLSAALAECMRADQVRLHKLLRRRNLDPARIKQQIVTAQERRRQRIARLPVPAFTADLPINEHREEIAQAIRENQVIVVCGATGSGKSTQLPKFCLDLGRGIDGYIGHTQPRRIAARSVAARLAQELGCDPGTEVGYKVRFFERFDADGYIKVLTDGMLLAELETDRRLDQYDTLILDEAHERSLNIDFLLGYLKRLLPRRPDLKLIITSATIDPQSFARHFDDAPVIEVSGRSYPVEVRYRPPAEDDERKDRNLLAAAVRAVEELEREGPGDILVFLPGERDIHELTRILRKHPKKNTEITPLYARLPIAEQQRVFAPHSGRRIVLATNVAETSLTVPGIRYVVDSGLARISRYSPGRQVQRLPVEPIAQSSAIQRSGRCGRTAPGISIRLYGEADFDGRPQFTEPEILRTSLAAVILRMQNMGLGAIDKFPFVTPPPERMINDGYRLLEELTAVDDKRRLTTLGRQLARLPVDPRIGRIIIAAGEHDCLSEILTIAAALEVNDPRDHPPQHLEKARTLHARHVDKDSDFVSLLKLWTYYHRETRGIGQRRTRSFCHENLLSYPRMREWIDVRHQLSELARELHLTINTAPAPVTRIHQALLSGLLGNIARADEQHVYLGTRGKHLYLHPGSNLFKRKPRWIMAAELVDTGKLYARMAAAIQPEWVEPFARDLVSRAYLEPHWEQKRGQVVAYEQVSLYGLVIIPRRKVDFGPIDPAQARELFIRAALVGAELSVPPPVIAMNRELKTELEQLEHKSRRRDVLVDDESVYRFYTERLPQNIHDARSFMHWLQQGDNARRLRLSADELMQHSAEHVTGERFPDHITTGQNELALKYNFRPGHPNDGVTLLVPLPLLGQLRPEPYTWIVPGLLLEKVIALIRSLPKSLRRNFVPAPDVAEKVTAELVNDGRDLTAALAGALRKLTGVTVDAGQFDLTKLAPHLFMNFAVLDPQHDGRILDSDRDLAALQARLADTPRQAEPSGDMPDVERANLRAWELDRLPEHVQWRQAGLTLTGYPALVDEGDSVAVRVFEQRSAADTAMRNGVLRLVLLQLPQQARHLRKNLPGIDTLHLIWSSRIPREALVTDIVAAAAREVIGDASLVRDQKAFADCVTRARQELVPQATRLVQMLTKSLPDYRAVIAQLDSVPATAAGDIEKQLAELIYPGFVSDTPVNWLRQYPRYFKALATRIERLAADPAKDEAKLRELTRHQQRLDETLRDPPEPVPASLQEYRFMLQEFRVSLFAQPMRTASPVSGKRLEKQWARVQSDLAH